MKEMKAVISEFLITHRETSTVNNFWSLVVCAANTNTNILGLAIEEGKALIQPHRR